jgi:prevent-host-death family protein
MEQVGVRALKQNASAVLDRVKRGESLEVTERGEPVALLVPVPDPEQAVERLVAEGRAKRPRGNLNELPSPVPAKGRRLPSEALRELRRHER